MCVLYIWINAWLHVLGYLSHSLLSSAQGQSHAQVDLCCILFNYKKAICKSIYSLMIGVSGLCLSCTGKRWISVLVHRWSVFQNTVTYGSAECSIREYWSSRYSWYNSKETLLPFSPPSAVKKVDNLRSPILKGWISKGLLHQNFYKVFVIT